jgi:hypothetical protein
MSLHEDMLFGTKVECISVHPDWIRFFSYVPDVGSYYYVRELLKKGDLIRNEDGRPLGIVEQDSLRLAGIINHSKILIPNIPGDFDWPYHADHFREVPPEEEFENFQETEKEDLVLI